MPEIPPACPHCGQNDRTYKVSLLYLECSARYHHQDAANQPELDGLLSDLHHDANPSTLSQLLSGLVNAFAPPSGAKQVARRIHPDFMVLFFGLIGVILVFQVGINQSGLFPTALLILCASVLAYLAARRPIIRRYELQMRQEKDKNDRVERSVSHWMRLYYCSRDQGVFDPQQDQLIPLEQMHQLLEL